MSPVSALFLLGIAAFALRAAPRLWCPHALTSDTYFHLYCARLIRASGFRLPHRLPQVVLGHEHTYPFLYHYLLALLPHGPRMRLERISSALFDAATLAAAAWFMLWLQGLHEWEMDSRTPLLVAALLAFSPALLRIGSGPRAYSGSPRPLGQLLYLLHILCAYHAFVTHSPVTLATSVLSGAAVFTAAKFSIQVLLFFAPFFAILVSPWYLALLLLSLAAALLLTGGKVWRVLVGHYRHSNFYVRVLQQIYLYPGIGSLKGYALALASRARDVIIKRTWKAALDWYFSEPHPLHLLLTVYTPFLLLPFLAEDSRSMPQRFLLAWTVAALIWFVATKTRPLRFLGEGERYLEYATLPSLLLAVDFMIRIHPAWAYGFLAYSVIAAAYYVRSFAVQNAAGESRFPETVRAFETLDGMPAGVVMPIGSLHWQTLYYTKFQVLTIGGNIDETLLPRDEFMLVYGRYPFPSADFGKIVERYGVTYVVSDRLHIGHYAGKIFGDAGAFFGLLQPLFESPSLVIYQVARSR
jgi:hypothetical protein